MGPPPSGEEALYSGGSCGGWLPIVTLRVTSAAPGGPFPTLATLYLASYHAITHVLHDLACLQFSTSLILHSLCHLSPSRGDPSPYPSSRLVTLPFFPLFIT